MRKSTSNIVPAMLIVAGVTVWVAIFPTAQFAGAVSANAKDKLTESQAPRAIDAAMAFSGESCGELFGAMIGGAGRLGPMGAGVNLDPAGIGAAMDSPDPELALWATTFAGIVLAFDAKGCRSAVN